MCKAMAEDDQKCLEILKNLRANVNWEVERQQHDFLHQFCILIKNWKGPLPNLRGIFRPVEIDWLLMQYPKNKQFFPIFDFIIRTGYKDEPEVDKNGKPLLRRETAVHWAAVKHYCISRDILLKFFKVYGNFAANYTDERGLTHFHVACEFRCYDVVEKFLKHGQDPNCPVPRTGDSPLHLALACDKDDVAKLLLRNGANPNSSNKNGMTPLHIICMSKKGTRLAEMLFNVSNKNHRPVNVDALNRSGQTPLHLALSTGSKQVAKLLLKNGADPASATLHGLTPLHIICGRFHSLDDDLAEIFSILNNDASQVNAQDNKGRTPLHNAVINGKKNMIELLLTRGANPNLATSAGLTVLHILCKANKNDHNVNVGLAKMIFEICDDTHQTVRLNVRDDNGSAPLHFALQFGNKKMVELLLRKGADPNLTTKAGLTPLHVACEREQSHHDDTPKLFFEIIDELRLEVQIDAPDKKGMTPLQYAVVSLSPKTFDVLLDHGADLSGFVFPAKASFTKYVDVDKREDFEFKLELTSGLMGIVECIEKRGYVLDRFNVIKIMEWLAKHKVFEKSTDGNESWYKGEEWTAKAKKVMMNKNVSLYDLIRLRPHKVAQLLTYEDCLRFARTDKRTDKDFFQDERVLNAASHDVCETISKLFFRRYTWILVGLTARLSGLEEIPWYKPINYWLNNEELFEIFQAAKMALQKKRTKHLTSTTKETELDFSFTLAFFLILMFLILMF